MMKSNLGNKLTPPQKEVKKVTLNEVRQLIRKIIEAEMNDSLKSNKDIEVILNHYIADLMRKKYGFEYKIKTSLYRAKFMTSPANAKFIKILFYPDLDKMTNSNTKKRIKGKSVTGGYNDFGDKIFHDISNELKRNYNFDITKCEYYVDMAVEDILNLINNDFNITHIDFDYKYRYSDLSTTPTYNDIFYGYPIELHLAPIF